MRLSSFIVAAVPLFGLAACAGDEFQAAQSSGGTGGSTASSATTASGGAGGTGGGATSTGSGGTGGGTTSTGSGGTGGTGGGTTSTGSGGSGGTGGGMSTGSGGSGGTGGGTTSTGSGGGATCPDTSQCVAKAPEGWMGPVARAEVSNQEALPPCPGNDPPAREGGSALSASPTCTQCTCGMPMGGDCGASKLLLAPGDDCTSSIPSFVEVTDCTKVSSDEGSPALSAKAAPAPVTGGACTPQGGQPYPWSWKTRHRLCGLPQHLSGCAEDQVCAGRSGETFARQFCVYQDGEVACPAGPYSQQTVFYRGVDDTRACASCDCGPPTARTCGGVVRLYSTNDCPSSSFQTIPANDSCTKGSFTAVAATYVPSSPAGGSCEPSTGSPPFIPGSATPKDPVTVCCMPSPP